MATVPNLPLPPQVEMQGQWRSYTGPSFRCIPGLSTILVIPLIYSGKQIESKLHKSDIIIEIALNLASFFKKCEPFTKTWELLLVTNLFPPPLHPPPDILWLIPATLSAYFSGLSQNRYKHFLLCRWRLGSALSVLWLIFSLAEHLWVCWGVLPGAWHISLICIVNCRHLLRELSWKVINIHSRALFCTWYTVPCNLVKKKPGIL